ncbi:hypothetical protein FGB62_294g08 [Gracilaria domingensis]|nr:hypothetical protein FGB62_294g08 [Gracilaria domingensis]
MERRRVEARAAACCTYAEQLQGVSHHHLLDQNRQIVRFQPTTPAKIALIAAAACRRLQEPGADAENGMMVLEGVARTSRSGGVCGCHQQRGDDERGGRRGAAGRGPDLQRERGTERLATRVGTDTALLVAALHVMEGAIWVAAGRVALNPRPSLIAAEAPSRLQRHRFVVHRCTAALIYLRYRTPLRLYTARVVRFLRAR